MGDLFTASAENRNKRLPRRILFLLRVDSIAARTTFASGQVLPDGQDVWGVLCRDRTTSGKQLAHRSMKVRDELES